MKINENFLKIESSYLFSTVAKKQREYQAAHPIFEVEIIFVPKIPIKIIAPKSAPIVKGRSFLAFFVILCSCCY